jgi:hypothetical protein
VCYWVFCWPCPPGQGYNIVFRFIIEYISSLRDFYRPLGNNNNNNNNNSSISIWGFLKDDILACVEPWEISYYRVIIISWRILVSCRGFFEDYIFCNGEIFELWYLEGFWVSFRGFFEHYIFCNGEIFEFP